MVNITSQAPWLDIEYNNLHYLFINNKLPRVILLHGHSGVGKTILAKKIASLVLDNDLDQEHPDLTIIGGINNKISIDNIRDLISRSQQTAYLSANKVYVILNSENLNKASANALLKILESKNTNNYFILTTDNYYKLLPTIVSRCFKLNISIKNIDVIYSWLNFNKITNRSDQDFLLEISSYAPFKAVELYGIGYLEKFLRTKAAIENLSANNLLKTHKEIISIFNNIKTTESLDNQNSSDDADGQENKDNKDSSKSNNKFNINMFINIINFILMKQYLRDKSGIRLKATISLIKQHKQYIDNNIAIDTSNAVYSILYSMV